MFLPASCLARILSTSGKSKFEHITPTLKDLNLLLLSDLLLIRDAVLVCKCMSNLAPDYLTCLRFKRRSSIHQHNTRNGKNLDIPKCRTAKAQNSFSYKGVSISNSLPSEILNSRSCSVSFQKKTAVLLF